MEIFELGTHERRVKVKEFDSNDNEIKFEESWFLLGDVIRNRRTNKDYIIDFQSKDSKTIGVIAKDEYKPYDIKENDYFYINRDTDE